MRVALVILVLVLVIAGCGGGNSRAAFVESATDVCADVNRRVQALGTPDSFTATQLYARQAGDAVGDGIGDLEALTPPEELEVAFSRYLDTLAQRRAVLSRMVEAADANSMKRIQQVGSDLDVVNAKARADARRSGIAGCEPG